MRLGDDEGDYYRGTYGAPTDLVTDRTSSTTAGEGSH
jgi:NADH-quinone oxidoreductase subunit I